MIKAWWTSALKFNEGLKMFSTVLKRCYVDKDHCKLYAGLANANLCELSDNSNFNAYE